MTGKRVTRVKDNSKQFIERLSPLSGAEVRGGYFAEQGNHKSSRRGDTGEPLSYVDLALLLHFGTEENEIPASHFLEWIPMEAYKNNATVVQQMTNKLKMVFQGRMKPENFMKWLASLSKDKADDLMGNPASITMFGVRGNDTETPLVDTGDLKEKFTTKVEMGGSSKK